MTVTNGQHALVTDYPLEPSKTAEGLKPLELLLAALAACSGSVVVLLLQRMRQPVAGLEIEVLGTRSDEHPTVFTHISMEFRVNGAGVDTMAVEQAIKQAEERLAPVWAMLKESTRIDVTSCVIEA